ncbi:MAG TPA: hypothetical protein VH352_07415 [Pseudonocardiaceae bacterium]|jgi:hypothetical protein|nr:hypothetical protein [Pseudonocardiaceae bacterium]
MSGLRVRPQWTVVLVVPVLAVVGILVVHFGSSAPPTAATTSQAAPAIHDITCDPADHGNVPTAVHLAVLVNGQARDIRPDIGFADALVTYPASGPLVTAADCFYWLHTGRADGVIHADPPPTARRTFTLGDFFDIWRQPLGTEAVGSDEGLVTSYVNGHRYTGNPRTIPLTEHATIQLDVGADIPPTSYTFPAGT